MGHKCWLIGDQGSGKTTVAAALAAQYSSRPDIVCAVEIEGGLHLYDRDLCDFKVFEDAEGEARLRNSADVLFLERLPNDQPPDVGHGDLVIRLERLPRTRSATHG